MATPTISTPGRIPVINFGDDSDYAGISAVLDHIGHSVVWQVEVNNSDILDGKVPNDFHVGFVTPNHDDTLSSAAPPRRGYKASS